MIPSMRYDEEVQEPGAARLASVFEWKNRPRRDVAWGYVYATMLVLTLAGGIAAYANRYVGLGIGDYLQDWCLPWKLRGLGSLRHRPSTGLTHLCLVFLSLIILRQPAAHCTGAVSRAVSTTSCSEASDPPCAAPPPPSPPLSSTAHTRPPPYSDPNFYKYATHPDFFNSPANCPAGGSGRRLLGSPDGTFDVDSLSRAAGVFIAISAVGSLFVGLLFVQLVRRNATAMAYVAMVTQVAAPAAIAVVLFATKNPVGGAILLVIAAVTALCFYLYRDAMALVARLMGIAGRGLHENPALILMVVLAQFGLLALCVPLVMSLLLALTNGRVVPNPVAVAADGSGGCADSFGDAVPCCGWATDGWVAPYMAFASITVTWTTMLVFQVKVFSISSTVAQWYFAPQTSAPAPPGLLGRWSFASGSGGRVMTSLRHAMGPSFGSLCFGSAVLTLVQYLRQAAKQKLQGDGNGSGGFNFVACMLACILDCIASFIE